MWSYIQKSSFGSVPYYARWNLENGSGYGPIISLESFSNCDNKIDAKCVLYAENFYSWDGGHDTGAIKNLLENNDGINVYIR